MDFEHTIYTKKEKKTKKQNKTWENATECV